MTRIDRGMESARRKGALSGPQRFHTNRAEVERQIIAKRDVAEQRRKKTNTKRRRYERRYAPLRKNPGATQGNTSIRGIEFAQQSSDAAGENDAPEFARYGCDQEWGERVRTTTQASIDPHRAGTTNNFLLGRRGGAVPKSSDVIAACWLHHWIVASS